MQGMERIRASVPTYLAVPFSSSFALDGIHLRHLRRDVMGSSTPVFVGSRVDLGSLSAE